MRVPFLLSLLVLGAVFSFHVSLDALAHQPPTPDQQREAMKKLEFLVGEWQGDGWMEFGPGQRYTFSGTEIVRMQLGGILMVIEGRHEANGELVHDAFAVISYEPAAQRYRFQGFTSRGNHEDKEAIVEDGKMIWEMEIPRFGPVRYTIVLDEQGRWHEIGEVRSDDGSWRQFFEMTLRRSEQARN